MTGKKRFIEVSLVLSTLAFAAPNVSDFILRPVLWEVSTICQEQFALNGGEAPLGCENGISWMIFLIQALFVFAAGYLLLVGIRKLLNVYQMSVITVLYLLAVVTFFYRIENPGEVVALLSGPADSFKDVVIHYLYAGKEALFMLLLAFIVTQPSVMRGRSDAAAKKTSLGSKADQAKTALSKKSTVKKPVAKKVAKKKAAVKKTVSKKASTKTKA